MEHKGLFETLAATPPEGFAYLLLMLGFYLLPTIIAFCGGNKARWDILTINVLLGWSGIFWFVALVFAMAKPKVAD